MTKLHSAHPPAASWLFQTGAMIERGVLLRPQIQHLGIRALVFKSTLKSCTPANLKVRSNLRLNWYLSNEHFYLQNIITIAKAASHKLPGKSNLNVSFF